MRLFNPENKYHNRKVTVDGIAFDSRSKYVFQNMRELWERV